MNGAGFIMADYQFVEIKHQKKSVKGIFLEYSLLKTKCTLCGDVIYSLRIESTQNGVTDYKLAFDISRDRSTATCIFNSIVSGKVTPCTLFDILEDIL